MQAGPDVASRGARVPRRAGLPGDQREQLGRGALRRTEPVRECVQAGSRGT